jgi:CheY-like chemotaxis protein
MTTKVTSKVLVVDDEETLTWSMTKTLEKDTGKYEIIIANTGTDALQILDKGPIDVVVTDIRMPDINGLELLSLIRKKYPSTKVIIMTAYGSPEVHKEAARRGSYYYLEKPFEISDIRALILKALQEERRGGFVGQVVDLQLVDIIQMGCLGRFTMSLTVSKGNEEGLIYFKHGEIVHAEVSDLEGKEALLTMLGWNEGSFNSQMGISAPKETITDRWEHLLLEGTRRRDEAAAADAQDSTVLLQEVEKAFEDLDKEAAIKELLESLLRILANIEGFKKGIWVDAKGNVLTADGQTFTEKEALIPFLMFTIASRMGRSLGNSQPLRVTIGRTNSQTTIMRYNHLFLMVALQERTTADEFFAAARTILGKKLSRVSSDQSKGVSR